MQKFYKKIVQRRKIILIVFLISACLCAVFKQFISVNYDMNDYLPEGSPSTVSLEIMEQEFEGGIPNARVMIQNVTLAQALEYKEQISAIKGVTDVAWLDDVADLSVPLEVQDKKQTEPFYKENTALFSVTIAEDLRIEAVHSIRSLIGDENAMTGSAVSTAIATESTVREVAKIAVIAVAFALLVLILTTTSWAEPFVVLAGLGIAVVINAGTNLIFGEISFVTNAAGNILQLAVSLDYSVFLLHRFEEFRKQTDDPKEAMVQALCKSTSSILSSGLTTVIGFLALVLMRFGIGSDLGLALAKGIAISLITVFVFMPGLILITYKFMDITRHRSFVPRFNRFGKAVGKIMVPLCIVFAVVLVPSFLASNANEYYFGSSHIFGEETQLGGDTQKIEEVFGESDTYVLLVPKGDFASETALSQALHRLPEVTSIISYVDQAGAAVPTEYLDTGTLSLLISDHYSRMVISARVPLEGETAFHYVEQVRSIANMYYPGAYYLAGEGVSTYDLMDTITDDMVKVNFVAIGAVFFVLLLTMKSISLPIILVLSVETAIWINLSIPYFTGSTVFYITYLIISSIQLGATVDYAILFTERYKEYRETMGRRNAISNTISAVSVSILTSGSVLTVVGFLLGWISTHGMLSQLGTLLGQGTLCSMFIVFFVLPGLLYILDGFIQKTSLQLNFHHKHKRGFKHESN